MQETLCNAGPLIVLGKLNRLELLADLYQRVTITQAVYEEVVTTGIKHGHVDAWTVQLFWRQKQWPIVTLSSEKIAAYQPPVLLDTGETEILALALTLKDPLVLIDDEIARAEARRLNLKTKGSLGVLVQAYHHNLLKFAQIELLVQEIAARPDIWISAQLCELVLKSLQRD